MNPFGEDMEWVDDGDLEPLIQGMNEVKRYHNEELLCWTYKVLTTLTATALLTTLIWMRPSVLMDMTTGRSTIMTSSSSTQITEARSTTAIASKHN